VGTHAQETNRAVEPGTNYFLRMKQRMVRGIMLTAAVGGTKLVWASNRHSEDPHETNVFIADWQ
jgi:hypothetical protein